MRKFKFLLVLLLGLQSSSLLAATGYRTALVSTVDGDNAAASASGPQPNTVFVLQTGAWNGGPNCPATYAYFNAKDYPHFVAILLTARASDRPVAVVVDDSLPKISGYCQITSVQL
jgi:hypothetical protein